MNDFLQRKELLEAIKQLGEHSEVTSIECPGIDYIFKYKKDGKEVEYYINNDKAEYIIRLYNKILGAFKND